MTPDIQRRLLFDMMRIRAIEEAIAARYGEQEMRCPVHLSIGQEGVAVGTCAALARSDYVMSTHRSHAHYLAKGGSLERMLAEIYGRATGCCGGKGGSMHIIDLGVGMLGCTPIVGGSLPVAVGTAFGNVLRGEPRVTVAFFGEGATEQGVFAESLNFAALKRLPVVFVCENNLYSVYSPMDVRQPETRDRVAIARAHGVAADGGDGNDVERVYGLVGEAVARAREGGGATFLEFSTYRWREHCGPNFDNDIGYRTEDEFGEWRRRCPIERYQARMLDANIVTPGDLARVMDGVQQEIAQAFAFAKASPFPDPETAGRDVYDEVARL
jgi:pyruvate dehydrogenase E1 component alpha subunit